MKKFIPLLALPVAMFAQEGTPNAQAGGMMQTLIMIGVALIFFYFILWRPEQKRRKEGEAMRNKMKKGDRVTAMAIVGTVDKINEHTIIMRMVDGSKIEMLKAAVTEVHSSNETAVEG